MDALRQLPWCFVPLALALCLTASSAGWSAQGDSETRRGAKIYIVCDLEGTAGVYDHVQQCRPEGRYFEQARRLATLELNAAVEGALEGGATEIFAWDGHGVSPGAIDIELLHPACKLVMNTGDGGPEAFDASFDGVFILGMHGMYGAKDGVLAHSFWPGGNTMWINGLPAGEIGAVAHGFGRLGVPFLMIAGDHAAIDEARQLVPDVQSALVKWGITDKGFKDGFVNRGLVSLSPEQARSEIKAAAKRATADIGRAKPFTYTAPYVLRTTYRTKEEADQAAQQPSTTRIDDLTVQSPPTDKFPL